MKKYLKWIEPATAIAVIVALYKYDAPWWLYFLIWAWGIAQRLLGVEQGKREAIRAALRPLAEKLFNK